MKLFISFLFIGLLFTHHSSAFADELKSKEVQEANAIKCGNLIYSGTKSSVCFADRFLTRVSAETTLSPDKKFTAVKLSSSDIFKMPFLVMSGEGSFKLSTEERENLTKFIKAGGFLLASPGCSDKVWDESFRREMKACFSELPMQKIPMTHQIFSTVYKIPSLHLMHGGTTLLEGIEYNGRLCVVYSKEGLNDVSHAKGCCCCGGDQIKECEMVNVNIFTYALLY